jgi:hypothetical protein
MTPEELKLWMHTTNLDIKQVGDEYKNMRNNNG